MRYRLALLAFAACGKSSTGHSDAAVDAIAELPVDAPPDSALDAPPPPAGHHHYVADHEHVPTSTMQARQFALDLGASTTNAPDGTVDNQLGNVLSALQGQGFDVAGATDRAVDTGAMIILLDYRAADLAATLDAGLALDDGADPIPAACASPSDTVCRHHLAGTGSFTVSATGPEVGGSVVGGKLTAGPGPLHLQTAAFGTPIGLDLANARVVLTMATDTTVGSAIVAGGVTQSDLNTKIFPSLQQQQMAAVAHDCTDTNPADNCGCASGSPGATAIGLFDTTPKDCMISVDEVKNNTLIKSLFAPDICSAATCIKPDLLSFGVQLTAVHADF
jgi:hypothetical protein